MTVPTLRPRSPWTLPVAFSAYGLVALAANWPAFPGDAGLFRQGDPTAFAWFLAWTPNALLIHQNLFFTNWLNFPRGVNLLQNTLSPLLGLTTAPLTLTAGPAASVNLLLWAAFPLSASAAFLLARRWVDWLPAAFVAGALYGFSPYMIGQGQIHLDLSFVPLPPLILLAVTGILRGERRWGWALGALITAQYFISAEVLASTAIVAALALAVSAVMHPRLVPSAVRRSLAPAGLAVAIAAVCLSYPVWIMISGPYHYQGPAFTGGLSADLLGAVTPTSSQLFAPAWAVSLGDRLVQGNIAENGSYLGPALLMFLMALLVRYWRSSRMRLGAITAVLCYILSLGPQLIVNGVNTGVPLPFTLLARLPLLDNMLAVRLSLYVDLFAALMVAVGLDLARAEWRAGASVRAAEARARTLVSRGARRWAWGGVVLATGALSVAAWIPRWPYPSAPTGVPAYFTSSAVRHIPEGTVTLISPYPSVAEVQPMLWQAAAQMRFRILGGYGLFNDGTGAANDFPAVLGPTPVQRFLWSQVTGGSPYPTGSVPQFGSVLVSQLRTFLARHHVGAVLWTPTGAFPSKVLQLFVAALGRPSQVTGGVTAWYGVQATLHRLR